MPLGSWKLAEDVTTAPKGYDTVPNTYLHTKVDSEKDLITTIFSRSSDPDNKKEVIMTWTFSVDDNYGGKNPNAETINGIVTDLSPYVFIGKQVFVDKTEHPNPVKDVFGADSMNVSIDGTHFDKSINGKETGLDIPWTWTVTQAVSNKNFDVLTFTDTLPSEVKYTGGAKVVQVTDDNNNPDTPFDPNKYDDAKNKDKSDDVTVDVTDNYDIKFDEKTNTLIATSKEWCYPVDEYLGLTPNVRYSQEMIYQISELSTDLSCRKGSKMVENLKNVFVNKNVVCRVKKYVRKLHEEKKELSYYRDDDLIKKVKVKTLYLEGDGVMIKTIKDEEVVNTDLAHYLVHEGVETEYGKKRKKSISKYETISRSHEEARDEAIDYIHNHYEIRPDTLLITNSDMGRGYSAESFE
ncbi:hypothetical protein FACS1894193_04690 [Bacilli bacterium]|nr:hypothetical protein FACS1894192_07740 [Bacilli bacterium]GHU41216.1 hypothetical protein FACS1894193_04690 [Bacilli bacterium]